MLRYATFAFFAKNEGWDQSINFQPPSKVFLLLLTKRERKLLFRCSNNLSWWKFTLEEILKMLTLARVLEPYPLLFKNFFKHLLFGIIAIVSNWKSELNNPSKNEWVSVSFSKVNTSQRTKLFPKYTNAAQFYQKRIFCVIA